MVKREVLSRKIITDYEKLNQIICAQKILGHKIAVTIGSWDLLHIGHARYLFEARNNGDILVVGVDSDRAVKLYKGDYRPIVPELERMEMLSYFSFVDYITVVDDLSEQGEWQYELIRLLKPDIFIAVEDSYPTEQITQIKKYCEIVKIFPRQAENTSTTNFVQKMIKGSLLPFIEQIAKGGKR